MLHVIKKLLQSNSYKLLVLFILGCATPSRSNPEVVQPTPDDDGQKIMLALLLDTSNSMDGLIHQAKSQLWTVVNELSMAKCANGARPDIEIALFEYGNSNLPSSEGYIRMVANLTDDLDEISEKLFDLTTNGGDEFCGEVIKRSIDQLSWSTSDADLKMIFIAGNEPFTQGSVSYRKACNLAKDNDIVVNTIFCGPYDEGIGSQWQSGAQITGGSYMSIEQDRKTVFIKTPYDDRIDELNDHLNSTYIYYGTQGEYKKEMQRRQDDNAESYSQANKVKRAISKSSHVYKNSSWDLVDALEQEVTSIEEVEEESLPTEMQGMSAPEMKEYVDEQAKKRKDIQKEISELSVKRSDYIAKNQPKEIEKLKLLDQVMIESIKDAAKKKDLRF